MRGRAAAWLALVAAGLLSGCGGSGTGGNTFVDKNPLPQDTMTTKMDELGRYGGRFVVGATASPKTFNPIMANETSSNDVISQLFASLTDIDYLTQEDIPMLAKSWDVSDGGRTVTYHLRRGARFSDGHPITSDDVKFCFDVVMDPALHPSMQDALTMDVGGKQVPFTYSAPDSYTFVVTAPATDALILAHVANIRILPRHMLETATKAGRFASSYTTATPPESLVTSGPWRLKQHLENQQTVLERNPYWVGVDAKGRRLPYLDEVVFRVAKDQDVAAQMFHAGELDGLDNVKAEDYKKYTAEQKQKGFVLYDIGAHFNTNFLWFNLNRVRNPEKGKKLGDPKVEAWKFALFSNRDFRRAVSMAVDRDAIIRGPYYGYGVKGWAQFTPGNPRWYDASITGPDLELEGANQLLDHLGLKDKDGDGVREDASGHPVAFALVYNADNKLRQAVSTLLQDDLAKVGIKLTPSGLDFNTMVTKTRHEFDYDACLLGLGSAVPSDPGMGPNFWKSSGLTHYWNVAQPRPDTPAEARIDSLFQVCIGTTDLAARKAAYRQMAEILNDECFVIWLPTLELKIPIRSRFGNVHPSQMPHRILWNSAVLFDKHPGQKN
ncbi:MAG TPA: ABC transporter substrate-binding protein [Methylomirabilota bacterium]|nr:ABC transporter substrate-binding protein [Methylomirabilota bacterium]